MSWPAFSSSEQHAAIAARAQRAAERLNLPRRPARAPAQIDRATDTGHLDKRLLLQLAAGPVSFEQLAIAIDGRHADAPRWRVIERRLAGLRLRGIVTYTATIGWSIKEID